MNDDRIDLSSLDPSRDAARWERLIQATATRAMAARRFPSFGEQVARWSRPALAMAASVALLVGGLAVMQSNRDAASSVDQDSQLLEWASADRVPSDGDVTSLYGSSP